MNIQQKKPKRILIVEDEKPIARALELKLLHEHFEIKCVFDGEACLEILKHEVFDLILLDLIMPKLDGFNVLKELKANKITTYVIVLSNLSQEDDEKRVKALGAKEFFIKSNTPIANIIERIMKLFSS